MNDNGGLEAVLAEYKAMREEIIRGKNREVQIYSIWIAFIGVFFGLVLGKDLFSIPNYDALLILPAFSSVFAFRFLWEHKVIRMVSDYICNEIEEKRIFLVLGEIPPQNIDKGEYNKCSYIGWQHYYYKKKGLKEWKSIFTSYWVYSFVALMLISFGIPILYSLLVLGKSNFQISICCLCLTSILSIIFVLLLCYSWGDIYSFTPFVVFLILKVILSLKSSFIKILNNLLVCPNVIPLSVFSPCVHWLLVWIYLTMFCFIITLFLKEKPEQEEDAETKKQNPNEPKK